MEGLQPISHSSPQADDPAPGSSSSSLQQLILPKKLPSDAVEYRATPYVVLVCITAASGGLLFGYDLAISGGVSAMEDFLLKFFPEVYWKKSDAKTDNYCKFDNQLLALFTSSLYIAGLVASFVASRVTKDYGRRASILTEMAPPNTRGILITMFQIAIGLGATSANLVNYGAQNIKAWGWRLSLSLAFVPAAIITIGFAFLPDSPSSLIQRGNIDGSLQVLKRIRGSDNVDQEFNYLLQAREISQAIKNPWKNIIKRNYRPQLVMSCAIPFFQQVTGINIITFYLPILIETLGFGTSASLFSVLILGLISIVVTIIGAFCIDKIGRRKVFLLGGSSMLLFLMLTGSLLQWKLKAHNELSTSNAIIGVIFILGFVACFSGSWGPLAWLIPSEIFPLEIRPMGQSISIGVMMLFISFTAQAFLAMLCNLKATIFYFFGGWVLVMTIFTYFLFPETKGVPLEEVFNLWKEHSFWRRYYT